MPVNIEVLGIDPFSVGERLELIQHFAVARRWTLRRTMCRRGI